MVGLQPQDVRIRNSQQYLAASGSLGVAGVGSRLGIQSFPIPCDGLNGSLTPLLKFSSFFGSALTDVLKSWGMNCLVGSGQ